MTRKYTRHTPRAAPVRAQPQAQVHPEPMMETIDVRGEMRPDMRAEPRDDPRARAAARSAQLLDHINNLDNVPDKFHIPEGYEPDGWGYEWKTRTVLGKEDPAYQIQLAHGGWEPVPASRHPDLMPVGYDGGGIIERDGQVLMERPREIIEKVRQHEYRKATGQMNPQQLNAAPPGQLPRDVDQRTMARVKTSYEAPIPIPPDA